MNGIKTILISLAALAATNPATRADELSDLVAAISASVQKELMTKDMAPNSLDQGKPRYSPSKHLKEVDGAFLDGILSSMKRESFRRMQNEIYCDEVMEDESLAPKWQTTYGRPFFRPVPGRITSRYGWRELFHRPHHGIDLALEIGDTVRCAISGTVSLISYDHDGYGHYVVLTHTDGMETLYGHLLYPIVAQGQEVYAGQPIGIGGNTGNSTGPHLHFEARLSGVAVDPLLLFDFYGVAHYEQPSVDISLTSTPPKTPTYSHQQKSLKHNDTYIVRTGDTMESVARQAGITVMRLCQLNMLNAGEDLPLGRMLKLK